MHGEIHVVDDEPDVLRLAGIDLHNAGYGLDAFPGGAWFVEGLERSTPGPNILDATLMDPYGFETLPTLSPLRDGVCTRDRILGHLRGVGKTVPGMSVVDVHFGETRQETGDRGPLTENVQSAGYKVQP
ncbi:MAG TPA: hypothetical protein PLQ43_02610 [Deltaproteobacteria bacterium]|nr:hypothetical protein [Deltaproteobacteria bacterium]